MVESTKPHPGYSLPHGHETSRYKIQRHGNSSPYTFGSPILFDVMKFTLSTIAILVISALGTGAAASPSGSVSTVFDPCVGFELHCRAPLVPVRLEDGCYSCRRRG